MTGPASALLGYALFSMDAMADKSIATAVFSVGVIISR